MFYVYRVMVSPNVQFMFSTKRYYSFWTLGAACKVTVFSLLLVLYIHGALCIGVTPIRLHYWIRRALDTIIREMYGQPLLWKFASCVKATKGRHEKLDIQWLVTNATYNLPLFISRALRFSLLIGRNDFPETEIII